MEYESELGQIECDPDCGFMIRSHDMDEIKTAAVEHARRAHNMIVTKKQMANKIMPVNLIYP